MSQPITFTTAKLSGPCTTIETVGFVGDFDFSGWPLAENDSYYVHDGRDFIRILPGRVNPEAGGNFSWMFRRPRWEALLEYEQSRFGKFKPGDMLRINEHFFPSLQGRPALTPGWHRDNTLPITGRPNELNHHMYIIGGKHPELNAEIALSEMPTPEWIEKAIGIDGSDVINQPEIDAYFNSHGGTRHLGCGEVACMPVSQIHRSSPHWNEPHPGKKHEFNRMKVLRAAL